MAYMLNYNHEMAIGTFQAALEADPDCMMAWCVVHPAPTHPHSLPLPPLSLKTSPTLGFRAVW